MSGSAGALPEGLQNPAAPCSHALLPPKRRVEVQGLVLSSGSRNVSISPGTFLKNSQYLHQRPYVS